MKSSRNSALCSPKEAIEILGISTATLYRMFQTGEIKKRKIRGKTVIKRSELETYIEELAEV